MDSSRPTKKLSRKNISGTKSTSGPATDALERALKRRRISSSGDFSTISDDSSLSSSASSSEQLVSMDDLFRSIVDFPVIEWNFGELEGSTGDHFITIMG